MTQHDDSVSMNAFVHQLVVNCLARGYFFYVQGRIPEGKDPQRIEAKLSERYGINVSKWTRARRKKAGLANVMWLRFGRVFFLIATHGRHRFFEEEAKVIQDVRRVPIKFCDYAIGHYNGHVHVGIEQHAYQRLADDFLSIALVHSVEHLATSFEQLPFAPYAPVRKQLREIFNAVNTKRKRAGLELVPESCLPVRRMPRLRKPAPQPLRQEEPCNKAA